MRKRLLTTAIFLLGTFCSFSQGIGIGVTTPDPSAILHLQHSGKGVLIPRMSTTTIEAIISTNTNDKH